MDNPAFLIIQLMTYKHESQQFLMEYSFLRTGLLFRLCFLRSGSKVPVCGGKKRVGRE